MSKKATTYLGYTTYFLNSNLIAKFNEPAKIVRCKSSGNDIRLGMANLTEEDKALLADRECGLLAAFDGKTEGIKFRGLLPSQVLRHRCRSAR